MHWLNWTYCLIIWGHKAKDDCPKYNLDTKEVPSVTVQLPVFNEMYVMQRLLDNIALLEYPREKLEIGFRRFYRWVCSLYTESHKNWQQGIDIRHITRTNRKGFKAGALKEGLEIARGDFIAIFDADFLPQKDWLLQTVPYFKNSSIGVVQTRWGTSTEIIPHLPRFRLLLWMRTLH